MRNSKFGKVSGKKLRMGRFAMPMWVLALAVAVVGAAAGQAVGPVLAGSTTGTVNLIVEQAITLDTSYDLGDNPMVTSGADDSVTTRNDEGTNITVASELHQGDRETVEFYLANESEVDGAAVLELNVPSGIDIEIGELGDLEEAQLSRDSWLMVVPADASGDGFGMTIEPKDDVKPGFYTIIGRLIQVSG